MALLWVNAIVSTTAGIKLLKSTRGPGGESADFRHRANLTFDLPKATLEAVQVQHHPRPVNKYALRARVDTTHGRGACHQPLHLT